MRKADLTSIEWAWRSSLLMMAWRRRMVSLWATTVEEMSLKSTPIC
jgi:hypothetical protein